MSATPRQKLLQAVVDMAVAGGITGMSLRAIAEAAGTSHRMLIHHFGSREGLLVEVIRAVEEQQRALLRELSAGTGEASADQAYEYWRHLRSPELAPQERLFFEVYGQALQGRSWAVPLLDGIVEDWVGPISATLEAAGVSLPTARAGKSPSAGDYSSTFLPPETTRRSTPRCGTSWTCCSPGWPTPVK
jgi:AcrR family transcriptional regulator